VVNHSNGEQMNGAADLINRLERLEKAKSEIILEVEATATDVEVDAIRNAPIGIAQKIQKVAENGGLTQRIEVNAGAIGAYLEFGTGSDAAALVPTLPEEWQQTAKQYYINGQGKLRNKAYLYPAWVRNTAGFVDRLKAILDKATK
jgi:hypothetical protein